jgi:hypothetical protein
MLEMEGWPSGLRRPVKTGFPMIPGRGFGDRREAERAKRASTSYSFVVDEKGFVQKIKEWWKYLYCKDCGGMAEWIKAAVLKTASRKSGTWVRILLPPPCNLYAG